MPDVAILVLGGLLAAFLLTTGIGLVRPAVRAAFRAWLTRRWQKTIRELRVRTNRFKLTRKSVIRKEMMGDAEILHACAEHARETGETLAQAEARVREYVEEIVPAFSLVSYYRVGRSIARFALNFLYKLQFWKDEIGDAKDLHRESTVVYEFNHRSNADFVLATFALVDRISLSWAIGEWARVWPLESLFKSFGGYFVRRGYKERLYHTVLKRYVQRVTVAGVTQGIFLEGRLSRTGHLGEPKTGLLDSIVQCAADPAMTKDIVFVPGGLNFDRALEDRALIAVGKGETPPKLRGLKAKWAVLKRTVEVVFKGSFKLFFRRLRKNGYAAIRFGKPISLRGWLAANGRAVLDLPREARQGELKKLAARLWVDVAAAIPAPAVPIACVALERLRREDGGDEQEVQRVKRDDLVRQVGEVRAELERRGVAIVRADKPAAEMMDYALLQMGVRGVVGPGPDGTVRVLEPDIVGYYAASIAHHLGTPAPPRQPVAPGARETCV